MKHLPNGTTTQTMKNENCIILSIRITRGTVIKDHDSVRYNIDFVNKVETEEGKIRKEVKPFLISIFFITYYSINIQHISFS